MARFIVGHRYSAFCLIVKKNMNFESPNDEIAINCALNYSMEKCCQVDVDFAKAFDIVPYELTLKKLERLGLAILAWTFFLPS